MFDYVLDEEFKPIAVSEYQFQEYIKLNGNPIKHIAFSYIEDILISTIFLGHMWPLNPDDGSGVAFFETMVLGGKLDEYQQRWATYEQAVAGHQAIVGLVKASEGYSIETL